MEINQVKLRPATAADEPFLLELYSSTRAQELDILDLDQNQKQAFVNMQFNAQTQQYRISYPEAENGIILIDNRPIGRMIIDRGQELTLVDIALLPEYRRHGIGS